MGNRSIAKEMDGLDREDIWNEIKISSLRGTSDAVYKKHEGLLCLLKV